MSSNYKRGIYVNGDMLKAVMKIRGISQIELAEAINVHRNTIGAAINKNRIERKEKIYQTCKVLNIFPGLLLEPTFKFKNEDNSTTTIDASNISDHINDISSKSFDLLFYSEEGISDFFSSNSNGSLLNKDAKEEIYWSCMEYKNLLIDLYFEYLAFVEENKTDISFSDYIKHNIIRVLKENGYSDKQS